LATTSNASRTSDEVHAPSVSRQNGVPTALHGSRGRKKRWTQLKPTLLDAEYLQFQKADVRIQAAKARAAEIPKLPKTIAECAERWRDVAALEYTLFEPEKKEDVLRM
jgi:hypothetical protein